MGTELVQIEKSVSEAIQAFSRVADGIESLKHQYAKVVFDVKTPKGMTEAKLARAAIREPRLEIERARKVAKAPILEAGRKLDEKAKELTEELESLEEPIHRAIKNEEDRKEKEKADALAAEERRKQVIQARIENIRSLPLKAGGKTAAHAREIQLEAETIVISESYAEFAQIAAEALQASIAAIRGIVLEREAFEAEQARIQQEREELAALRAAEAERQAAERARLAEEEARAKAARDAEAARQAEALRVEREALEAQKAEQNRREAIERARIAEEAQVAREAQEAEAARHAAEMERIRAEQDAAAQVERDRLAAERAEFERQQAEAWQKAEEAERIRLAAEAAERKRQEEAEKAARKAKYPGDQPVLDALTTKFDVSEAVVRKWLQKSFGKSGASNQSQEAAA